MKTTTILKAAQASEFLAAIPALIGYTPTASAVVVPFRGNRTAGAMRFDLPDAAHAEWPPADAETPVLPTSMRLVLSRPGEEPLRTEVLVQTANGIRSPIERKVEEPEEP